MAAALRGATIALAAVHAAIVRCVNREQPTAYMDEIFHAPQAAAYCRGEWQVWDPKITTFPGVYVLSALLSRAWGCEVGALRAMNAAMGLAILPTCYAILRRRHPAASSLALTVNALILSMLPTSFFFHFLYYTDTAATLLVLLGLLCAQHGAYALSALPLGLAVLVRQTSIVWAAFVLGAGLLRVDRPDAAQRPAVEGRGGGLARFGHDAASDLVRALRALLARAPRGWAPFAPLLLLLAAFGAFVLANGGVVVGDRANHVPTAHGAQLLYFCAFCAAMGDASCWSTRLGRTLRACARAARAHPLTAALALGAALGLVHSGTVCHPFLLADNRHFTFYLWKDVLRRPALRYLAAVPYCACAHVLYRELRAQPPLWVLLFAGCTALALVPSPLLELRYLSVPHLLLRLHAPLIGEQPEGTSADGRRGRVARSAVRDDGAQPWPLLRRAAPTLLLHAAVNALALGLFINRPFVWADGSVARFMW